MPLHSMLRRLRLVSLCALGVAAVGCQTTGGEAKVHKFDPLVEARVGAEDLEPVDPQSIEELLEEADAAFARANEAQEKGDYESALRNYNYMLELIIQADLDPAVYYNLRTEFGQILDTTVQQARLYERGRIREWTEEDYRRFAGVSDLPMPTPLPKRVLDEIDKIQNVYPKNFQNGLNRSVQYLPYVRAEFAKAGLPQDLVWLAMVESQFHPRATSRVGAGGMWQFMRTSGRRFDLRVDSEVDERYNWQKATRASAEYLQYLYTYFGDWALAASAYNRGEGGIERDIARGGGERNWWRLIETPSAASHIPTETKEFYAKLLASIIVAKNPEKYGFKVEPYTPVPYTKIAVNGPYRLSDLDKALGLRSGALADLNPDLVNKRTPSRGTFELTIPAEKQSIFASAIENVGQHSGTTYASTSSGVHVVRRGDTLSEIASRYGTSVKTLMAANKIKSATRIRVGQRITVPGAAGSSSVATSGGTYTVRKGDTLSEIAGKQRVKIADLQRWNNMGSSTQLRVGQRLHTGDPGSAAETTVTASTRGGEAIIHTVAAGEYPAKIANRYGVKTNDLLSWNKLSTRSTIRVGQKLKVYAPQSSSDAATVVASAPTATSTTVKHKVARGESASVIASKYGVKTNDFLAWNGLTKRSVLKVGETYIIKKSGGDDKVRVASNSEAPKTVHTVSRGESAWTIAQKYRVDMDDLFSWNGWTKAPTLRIGSKVNVYAQ